MIGICGKHLKVKGGQSNPIVDILAIFPKYSYSNLTLLRANFVLHVVPLIIFDLRHNHYRDEYFNVNGLLVNGSNNFCRKRIASRQVPCS